MKGGHPILGALVALIAPIALTSVFTSAYFEFVVLLGIRSCIAMAVIFTLAFFSWSSLPGVLRRVWIFPALGAAIAAIGMLLEIWSSNPDSVRDNSWYILVWTLFGGITGGIYMLCVDGDDSIEESS